MFKGIIQLTKNAHCTKMKLICSNQFLLVCILSFESNEGSYFYFLGRDKLMKKEYEPLFTPWKIGNVEIPNRIVQTSMGGTSLFGWLEPCHFDKEAAHHILGRAQDGVGLVLPGM